MKDKNRPELYLKIFAITRSGGLSSPLQGVRYPFGKKWSTSRPNPLPCKIGWHVFKKSKFLYWRGLISRGNFGGVLALVEGRGAREVALDKGKIAFESIRIKKILFKGKPPDRSISAGTDRYGYPIRKVNPAFVAFHKRLTKAAKESASR